MHISFKISAVLLCKNSEKTLQPAIDSIRGQNYPIEELWALDDASKDNTFALANQLIQRVYQNPKSLGRGYMRYLSIEGSSQNFILSCDASIALEKDFLTKALSHFENEQVAAVFGALEDLNPSLSFVDDWRKRHLFKQKKPHALSEKASLQTAAVIFRKAAILEVGNFNKAYKQGEDKELGERLLKAGWKVVYDPTLKVRPLRRDTFFQVLERYWRWNSPAFGPLNFKSYLKQIVYSLKVMALEDFKHKEYANILLSLCCPHYQFFKSWLQHLKTKLS